MPNPRLHWRYLDIPATLTPAALRAVLLGLSALPGQPRLILETIGSGKRVMWRLGASDDVALRKAAHVLRTHLPDVLLDATAPESLDRLAMSGETKPSVTLAAQLRISRHRDQPLSDRDRETTVRALLAAVAAAGVKEQLRLQLVLGPRTWPRNPRANSPSASLDLIDLLDPHGRQKNFDVRQRSNRLAKHGQHGFGCTIRILATSGTTERARNLIGQVGAALRGIEAADQAVQLRPCSVRSVEQASSPWFWPLWLSIDDLLAVTGLPVTDDPKQVLPGMRPPHPRLLPATTAHPSSGATVYGLATADIERGRERPIAQAARDRLQHLHVLGPTGVGKSTLLAQLALQDIEAGRGVVVIDPKADLVTDILSRIPEHRRSDIVVLDPSSDTPVGFNPLAGVRTPTEADLIADHVLAIFTELFGRSGLGPRSSDLLHAATLTLARHHLKNSGTDASGGVSLVMIPMLLTNRGLRRRITAPLIRDDPIGLGSFWAEYESLSDEARTVILRPLMNKLRTILLRPSLRTVLGQGQPRFAVDQVFTGKKILLVRLGKDRIGPEAASLLASLVFADLWRAALTRASLPANQRDMVSIVLDEAHDALLSTTRLWAMS